MRVKQIVVTEKVQNPEEIRFAWDTCIRNGYVPHYRQTLAGEYFITRDVSNAEDLQFACNVTSHEVEVPHV